MIRIKICGIQSPGEALAVAAAGANAIGVIVGVKARSEHGATPAQAAAVYAALASDAPGVKRVLVTHETDPARLAELVTASGRAGEVQLHAPMTAEIFRHNIGWLAGRGIDVVRAIHILPGTTAAEAVAIIEQSQGAFAVLLDSATTDRLGGTGQPHDWTISAAIARASSLPVILAGGIKLENVQAALERVRPDGIDLNSGARTNGDRRLPQSAERVQALAAIVRQLETRGFASPKKFAW